MLPARSLLLSAALLVAASTAQADEVREETAETQLVTRINAMRRAAGVPPLVRLEPLDGASVHHSMAMARVGRLAHEVDGSADPGTRAREAGVQANRVSENVSRGADANAAHQAILNSEAHRQQLLNTNYTHLGVGVVRSGDHVWVTQMLAQVPASQPATPEPAAELPPPAETEVAPPPAAQPAPVAPPAARPAPTVAQPAPPAAAPAQPAAATNNNSVGAPTNVSNGRRIAGYWVFSRGRWWYFPLPEGASAGQELQPDLSVQGPPPGFSANPPVQSGQRMVVPRFHSGRANAPAAPGNPSITWQ